MKTFKQFVFICEKLNKTFDEDAHTKVWNYFISNPDYTEVRDALVNGDKEKALQLMRAEVEKARGDANHPLNFAKADDSEFATTGEGKNKRANREASDEDIFNQEIEKAVSGVKSLAGQKKFRDSVEKGFPARKTGGSKAEISRGWRSAGGTNATPKADIEIYDPDNEKNRRGVSLKKAGGSQIASAESGELQATYKAAAKSFVQRFYGDKSKEERKKIEKEINDAARRVGEINTQQRTASDDRQKTQLKDSGQEVLDKLHDKYPNLTRLVTQVSTTGDAKFLGRNAPGSAGTILTGDKAKPAEEQPSARPRNAKPKERGRPGNVKIDNKEAPTKSNQEQPKQGPIAYKEFQRKSRSSELRSKGVGQERDERIAAEIERVKQEKEISAAEKRKEKYDERKRQAQQEAELEQQSSAAQQDLAAAEQEKADAQRDLETNSDGTKTYLQHRAQKRINNPNLNSRLTAADNAVQVANTTIADIQARAAQAAEKPEPKPQAQQQTQPQRTEPVDTKPTTEPKPVETPKPQEPQQTPKPQEPQQTPKPQEPQQTPNPQEPQETPVDKKEKGRKKLEARMDAAGQRLGLQ
jgi:hypothetical protein